MEKETYTRTYLQPMTMMQYDNGRIIGYLHEEVIEGYVPEDILREEQPEPTTGYRYTGTEEDGGTLMPCSDSSDYGEVVNAIIRSSHTESEEMAIHRHHINDPALYAEEWDRYNRDCEAAKVLARKWLGMDQPTDE